MPSLSRKASFRSYEQDEASSMEVPPYTHHNPGAFVWTDSRALAENPRWRSMVANHQNATRPYSRTTMTVTEQSGRMRSVAKSQLSTLSTAKRISEQYGSLLTLGEPSPLPVIGHDIKTEVYLAFVRKANNELRALRGGTAIGELAETIHMVRHPLESLKEAILDYGVAAKTAARKASRKPFRFTDVSKDERRTVRSSTDQLAERGVLHLRQRKPRKDTGPTSRATAITRAISGTYLEYANGWAPLVKDVIGASKALAEHFTPSGVEYRRLSTSAKRDLPDYNYMARNSGVGYLPQNRADLLYNEKQQYSCRMRGEVIIAHTGDASQLVSQAGFDLGSFLPTVFELIPLSYVLGYFSNMSALLEGFCFNRGNVSWWSRTTRRYSEYKVSGSATAIGDYSTDGSVLENSGTPGQVIKRRVELVRDDLVGWMPSHQFSLPGSHLVSKLANTTSLAAQFMTHSRQISRLLQG